MSVRSAAGTELWRKTLWVVTMYSLRAVYGPDGNPQSWSFQSRLASGNVTAIDVQAVPNEGAEAANEGAKAASKALMQKEWLDLYSDAWTSAHRACVMPIAETWADENAAAWAMWHALGPLLLLNAAFASAGQRRKDTLEESEERKAVSARERRQLASRDVDCKRLLLRLAHREQKMMRQMREARARSGTNLGWQRGRS